jgi:amino-acid N-acetyltransferase
MTGVRGLLATPLAAWERDGIKTALIKTGLQADDVTDPRLLLWRFESSADIPAGFGGLEIHGRDALMRSIVILPPLRGMGMGSAIVTALEGEARALNCRSVYLITLSEADFFARLGYGACRRTDVPEAIQQSHHFTKVYRASATVMVKAA